MEKKFTKSLEKILQNVIKRQRCEENSSLKINHFERNSVKYHFLNFFTTDVYTFKPIHISSRVSDVWRVTSLKNVTDHKKKKANERIMVASVCLLNQRILVRLHGIQNGFHQ